MLYNLYMLDTMTSFMDIVKRENGIGEMILQKADVNTSKSISYTCNVFKKIVKEDMKEHYIQYSKKMIPEKFKDLVTSKMFAHYNNSNNTKEYKSIEEYDEEIIELSKKINDDNRDDIMKSLNDEYLYNKLEMNISRGTESMIYAFISDQYHYFITEVLHLDIQEEYEYEE